MKNKFLLIALTLSCGLGMAQQVTFTTQTVATLNNSEDRGLVDMNGDFLDDIVSVTRENVQIFYQQADGTLQEVNIPTTFSDYPASWSMAAGDFDGNGYNDLLYGGGSGVTFMKANNTGTGFTEISGSEYVFSQRSNFIDINNDGHLDAYVCHDVEPSVYYINDGNGNLQYNQGGLGDYPTGGHYGSVWVDYDNDRDMDLFIAKCGGESARRDNEMHRNNGDGTFTEVGASINLEDSMQTWSSAWADYDNDGDLDIWIGASTLADGFHRLMRNNGDGTFTDVINDSGLLGYNSTDIENATHDFNNDGFADIIAAGRILYGNGDLTFTVTTGAPFSAAYGDINNDGFIDAFGFGTLRINNGNSNNWLKINTIGTESNLNGIGARIEISSALGNQMRDIRSGEGFGQMSSLNAHFGLGEDTTIDTVTVYWPSGIIDVLNDVDVNQTLTITEGTTLGVDDNAVANLILYPNPAIDVLNIGDTSQFESPFYSVFDMSGKRVMNGSLNGQSLDISQLAEGVYILRVADRRIRKSQKFSKKR
ncbi:MAG: FG-GAP-like repeat-containing protein [Patiriisocius sp.]|uniref:FG-GAP-like repeat-containing protein n=1 Tax=Patiriisocius sp. TaxID=2822396 RepID=UPI003EFAFC42